MTTDSLPDRSVPAWTPWVPALPPGWHSIATDLSPELEIYAGPEHGGFAPNVVVGRGPRPASSLPEWNATTMQELRTILPDMHLLDELPDQVNDHPAIMRVAVHTQDGRSLTFVQWTWFDDASVVTATCTSTTHDHSLMADIFATMVRRGHYEFGREATPNVG